MKAKVTIVASLMCVSAWSCVADVTNFGAKGDGATKPQTLAGVAGVRFDGCTFTEE